MKRILKTVFLGFPALFLIFYISVSVIQKRAVNQNMKDADGLVWEHEGLKYLIEVKEPQPSAEQRLYVIHFIAADTKMILLSRSISFDFDMYGGGFVSAVQADSDPELEIFAWGMRESRESFILDFSRGTVQVKPFSEAFPELKQLALKWHKYNIMRPFETIIIVVVLIFYYLLFGIFFLIYRKIKK